jgi:hypothetical protein
MSGGELEERWWLVGDSKRKFQKGGHTRQGKIRQANAPLANTQYHPACAPIPAL